MKRFLLFAGANNYPYGGFEDFICSKDTLQQCVDFYGNCDYLNWAHIYDSLKGEIVKERKNRSWIDGGFSLKDNI